MSVKTTVITGATSGIGKETALALAKKDHAVYMLVRDVNKGGQVAKEIIAESGNIAVYVVECNLTDLHSIRTAAGELKSKLTVIDVLINNAGGIFPKRELSTDGFEMTFATNYLGHFALTKFLMPLLVNGHARVINLSSEAYKRGDSDPDKLLKRRSYSAFKAYCTTKLFNIFFTKSLAEKYGVEGITSYSLHPGLVKTDIGANMGWLGKLSGWLLSPFMIKPQEAAQKIVYLATQPKIETKSGYYYEKSKPSGTIEKANDFPARNRLWILSEQLTGVTA